MRLKSKSPKFFFVLQLISASLVFAGGLPLALREVFGLELSDTLKEWCKDVAVYSLGLWSGATFTVNGAAQNDKKKLPYTLKEKPDVDTPG